MKRLAYVAGLLLSVQLPSADAAWLKAVVKNHVVNDVSQGWCSASYVPTLKKFLAIFVNHYSPGGYQDNSLRAFDPATGTVEYLHPKDVPGAPRDRDNHNMVYNPFTNEIWITSAGGLILDVAKAYASRNTPPSYGAVGWSGDLSNAAFGTAASVKNWPSTFMKWNAMVDWHDSLDMGVIFSGVAYTGQGVSNDLYLVKPNPTPNAERYVFINAGNFDSILSPPGYVKNYIYTSTFNGRHNGRILGDYFYFLSVDTLTSLTSLGGGNYSLKIDFYRYDLKGPIGRASLFKMAPLVYTVTRSTPPDKDYGMNFPCVTADTRLNALLVRLAAGPPNNLYAYLPDSNVWQKVQTDLPVRYLRLGACDYSPDHRIHAYQDGVTNTAGDYDPNVGWSTISLSWDSSGTGSEKGQHGTGALEVTAFPNPFSTALGILVTGGDGFSAGRAGIYDLTGKSVGSLTPVNGRNAFSWDAAGLPGGVYLLKVSIGRKRCVKRLLLRR